MLQVEVDPVEEAKVVVVGDLLHLAQLRLHQRLVKMVNQTLVVEVVVWAIILH
jgi:hypothetical protein